uniref:YLPM1-like spectrin repeat domain-containing protein n=1 Tax=Knipowitschia caucasica TaxID=637954 RepID=A0AAV2KBA9_KNICA
MFPWGTFGGAQQPQNYGANNSGNAAAFGGSGSGSVFSSLQEQHLQQMQQLQMLHQKQLQSVLHHGAQAAAFAAQPAQYPGSMWPSTDTVVQANHPGPTAFYSQNNSASMHTRGPISQPQDIQPPPPSQPPPAEQPAPPPPEPPAVTEHSTPKPPAPGSDTATSLQDRQQQWYKQHLLNLQKMKQDKAKQNQKEFGSTIAQPPPPKSEPPPPPPTEEPPAPPPPPPSEPETPNDPEEVARLKQLQAAAAQWQHVQQQKAGLQYQALMKQHENLQKVLEQYQQLIQQPPNLQSLSAELQFRYYKTLQQKFVPMYEEWDRTFKLWWCWRFTT